MHYHKWRNWRKEIYEKSSTLLLLLLLPLQLCPTLCDPIDGSPPGSPVPGILQARTLVWVAISFSIKYALLCNNFKHLMKSISSNPSNWKLLFVIILILFNNSGNGTFLEFNIIFFAGEANFAIRNIS